MAQSPSMLNKPTAEIAVAEMDGKELPIAKKFWAWLGALGGIAGDWTVKGDLTVTGGIIAPVAGILGSNPVLYVRDEKASGTDGGDFTQGAWRTRTLNTTVVNEISGASLAADQVTLPAGTYRFHARAPGRNCGNHKCKLANITDGTDALIGSSVANAGASNTQGDSMILDGEITITAAKVFELQDRCTVTRNVDGFGINSGFGVVEVYAELWVEKLA